MTHNAPHPATLHHTSIDMVWLDLDDTLVDFRKASRIALGETYEREGLARFFHTQRDWESAYEAVNFMLWQQYAEDGVDRDTLRLERFRRPLMMADVHPTIATAMARRLDGDYLRRLAQATELLPEAEGLLRTLRAAGLRIGILSNGFTEVQHDKLRRTGLDKLVDIMVLSDEIGVQKPSPRLFAHAMERAGMTAPQRQLMIGDNAMTDIAGAVASGWQAILLDRSLPLLSTRGQNGFIVSSLAVIPSLLGIPALNPLSE